MPNTEFINGLRAIAAMTVLIAHCMIWSGWPGLGAPAYVPYPGEVAKMAVDLFMILSGFLMALHAHQRMALEPMSAARSWFIFYARRFFRIAPTYYLAIIIALVLAAQVSDGSGALAHRVPWLDKLINGHVEAKATDAISAVIPWYSSHGVVNVFMHVTFLFGLFPAWVNALPLPDWSLSLEMQFYLVFPALILFSSRFGMLKICMFLVPLCIFSTWMWRENFPEPSFLLFKLPVFLSGMLLFHAITVPRWFYQIYLRIAAVALMATQYPYYGVRVVLVMAVALFIAFVSSEMKNEMASTLQGKLRTILGSRLAEYGSELAYPIYLFHSFWIMLCGSALFRIQAFEALNPHVRTSVFTCVVFVGTIYVSLFVHHLVEAPGIIVGRRVISRLRGA
jgi:peptidoglycan/LPS O-acetylase OafA/YrhL